MRGAAQITCSFDASLSRSHASVKRREAHLWRGMLLWLSCRVFSNLVLNIICDQAPPFFYSFGHSELNFELLLQSESKDIRSSYL